MKKFLLSSLLGVFLLGFGGISMAENYNLWVGGTQVTSENQNDILGDGKVIFNPSTNTLNFDDATLMGKTKQGSYDSAVVFSSLNNLTIEGSLTINSSDADRGILAADDCNVTIRADINSNKDINIGGDFIIESGTIILNGASSLWSHGAMTIKSTITKIDLYDNGNNASNEGYIGALNGITIEEPLKVTHPSGEMSIKEAGTDYDRIFIDNDLAYQIIIEPVQEITNINISGIVDPVLGEYPVTGGITITSTPEGAVHVANSWRSDFNGQTLCNPMGTCSNNRDTSYFSNQDSVQNKQYFLTIIYTIDDGYVLADNVTITTNGNGTVQKKQGAGGDYIEIIYNASEIQAAPEEIEHILLIGDLGRFVHGTTPPTNITTNTTGINLGAVTWGKGSSCTPLEANETFVSSSNYDDYYCLTIPFTVDTGYVLRNNYYIYRKNIGADRSTNRVYASDYEYACTASEIKIKYLYAEHTIDFMVDGQPRNDTRYRRNGCTLWECGSYGAYPQQPTKDGYVFEGWYTEDTFDNKWNWYSSGITENMTLYANWLDQVNNITISGITVPASGAQATLSGIEKSADPITGVNRGTLVWKAPTSDNPEDPQPVDFDGIFQGGKSYRLYVPFTIAEGYGIQKGYSNPTIFTVNGTQKSLNDIYCYSEGCHVWLSYYIPYIITFYDGETVYTTGTAYGGDTIDYTWSITNPYVSGKKFLGWFKDPEFTQQRRLDTDTVTGDMNLYGKFANQLMNINLTGVVAPVGDVAATVAGISLAEGTSGVQLGTLKWKEGESDFNGKYVSGTQYTLYVPFKLIDDYVMPDYYSYVSLSINGEYFYKEIGATGNEDYPYYIRTYFTAKAPATGTSEPAPSAGGSSGGGGGGGGSVKNTDTQTTEVKNDENNKQDETKLEENKSEEKQENNTETPGNTQNDSQKVLEDGLTQEFHDAYDFAYKNGITTMPSAKDANMKSPLTRIAMAKMLSNYAINVLGKKPANKVVPKFPDIDEKLNEDYGGAVDLAYQLGIMGIGIENFRPFDLVPRAEFVTALSRMLYGIADGDNVYYETHLKKLKEEGIITNDNPNLQEVRGYVMIMLMRSAK